MYCGYFEEGDTCPECLEGRFYYPPVENCSCHINAPCSNCTHRQITCDTCGYEPEEPEHKDIPLVSGLTIREYKPAPLDPTRIDYRIKMHTGASQICEGVYPEGTTKEQVEAVIRGTFGGKFVYFRNGKFKYIAYTDL